MRTGPFQWTSETAVAAWVRENVCGVAAKSSAPPVSKPMHEAKLRKDCISRRLRSRALSERAESQCVALQPAHKNWKAHQSLKLF